MSTSAVQAGVLDPMTTSLQDASSGRPNPSSGVGSPSKLLARAITSSSGNVGPKNKQQ
ncbi:hypothetical protein ACJRO7_011183, partial [Eucalyptus globulus]